MAEALLRDRLARRGVPANVHSAGLLDSGRRASDHGIDVLRGRGLAIDSHRSTTLRPEFIDAADLILGMARLHVRETVVSRPAAWSKAFTLKELVRRGEELGGRSLDESLQEWLDKAHAGRTQRELLGESDDDDIFDPIGSSRAVYEKTAAGIEDLIDRLVALLLPGQEPIA